MVDIDEAFIEEQMAICVRQRSGLWNQQTYLLVKVIRELTQAIREANSARDDPSKRPPL